MAFGRKIVLFGKKTSISLSKSMRYNIIITIIFALRSKKHDGVLFCSAVGLATFVLSGLSLTLLSGRFDVSTALPVFFSLIFVIIAIVLVSYGNMLLSMEQNARQDILISKYELEESYFQNMKNYMESFRTIRHDFKNHLITLDIYAKQKDTFLQITCKNNHTEKIVKKNGDFVTTKENPGMFHGLGIKNVQNSVEELNGTLDIQHTDSTFTVSILMPNYN